MAHFPEIITLVIALASTCVVGGTGVIVNVILEVV